VKACVYLLRGSSGRYYIGATSNPGRRLSEHQRGSCHSSKRLGQSIELVVTASCSSMAEARALERRLKRMKNPAAAIAFVRSMSSPA